MVLFTNFVLALALALASVVSTAQDETLSDFIAKHPEIADFAANGLNCAYLDPDTHSVVKQNFAKNEKRSAVRYVYKRDDDRLTSLLKYKKAQNWCQSYCDPRTKTITKTVTVKTTATVCGGGYGYEGYYYGDKCKDTTKTKTVVVPGYTTSTITDDQTVEITITSTDDANPTTSTTTVTTAGDTITRTTTLTSTSTVPFPGDTQATPAKRAISLPTWLKPYNAYQVSSACSNIIPKPTTLTKTLTKTYTQTYTHSPKTITKTITKTHTTTKTATVHPTSSTTVVVTPTVLATTTVFTTDTLTVSSTTTTTVCPQATEGITGIAVTPPGSLRFPNAPTAAQCCKACFDAPGCNAWWSVKGSICAYAVGAPPNSGTISAQCPNGNGDWSFFDGGAQDGTQLGGGGQCAGTRQ